MIVIKTGRTNWAQRHVFFFFRLTTLYLMFSDDALRDLSRWKRGPSFHRPDVDLYCVSPSTLCCSFQCSYQSEGNISLKKKKEKVRFFHVFCHVTCRNMSFVRWTTWIISQKFGRKFLGKVKLREKHCPVPITPLGPYMENAALSADFDCTVIKVAATKTLPSTCIKF